MFKWIGKLLIGEEIQKLREEIGEVIRQSVGDMNVVKAVKHTAYLYLDSILQEGKRTSADKIDAWWDQKRNELKVWAGE